jgi:hypothetical protein
MSVPILRTSERKLFKQCQSAWWWAYREGLRRKGVEATALWFGTGVHLALEKWYKPGRIRGVQPAETFKTFAGESLRSIKTKMADMETDTVAEYENGAELGVVLLEEYVKHYGADDSWDIIQPEQEFHLPIPYPPEERQKLYQAGSEDILVDYHGRYDAVYRDLEDGKVKLLETKTARSISTTHLPMDDQAGSYWAIAGMYLRRQGLIRPKEELHGITYNFLRKGMPYEGPRDAEGYATNKPQKQHYTAAFEAAGLAVPKGIKLEEMEALRIENRMPPVLGERSKVQPAALFQRHTVWRTSAERRTQLRRIQDEALQMELLRDGSMTRTKTPGQHCSWCQFNTVCSLEENGGDWQSTKRVAYRVEDPYGVYRKSTEE